MKSEIQELLTKYRNIRRKSIESAVKLGADQTQSIGFRNGEISALEMVIEDLRELVLNDERCGV